MLHWIGGRMKKDLTYYLSLPFQVEVQPIPEKEGGGFMARLT
jgi:hypothetical protein